MTVIQISYAGPRLVAAVKYGDPMSTTARGAFTAYGLLSVVNLVAIGASNAGLSNLSQWLLMPVLAAAFLALTPRGPHPLPRLRTATLAALGFSWLGDLAPDFFTGDAAFIAMVACFLCAQIAFIVGFLPHWRASVLGRARGLLVPYAVTFLVLIAACAPAAGPLLVPVVIYGLALTAMAVLATGLGRLAGLGGAIFMLSDSLIALGAFRDWNGRGLSVAIMATYAVAQALLVIAIQRFRQQAQRRE